MPLLNDHLSVWEITHRWAGYDPEQFRIRLPLVVRDNARILFAAIEGSEIDCLTLQVRKWAPEDGEDQKPYFIRYHLQDIWDLIAGKRYDRKLMKWAILDRYDFYRWCEGHKIPFPEFWFAAGWGLSYDWTAEEEKAEAGAESDQPSPPEDMRASARSRIMAQGIATSIWSESPGMTIADMIRHPDVVRYAKASHYQPDTVRGWLSEVAPEAVRNKRGRPRKNPVPSSDGDSSSD